MAASRECQLADGRAVVLRVAGPGDVPPIARLYLDLSAESFYRRFNTGQPVPALVAQLASVGNGSICVVATAVSGPGRVVAEARCVPIAPGTAELALTVADGYQGAGLGRLLLDALVAQAHQEGLQRLRAVVLLANTPMLRLLQRYGWVLAGQTEGFCVAFLEISAVGGMPGWPAGSAGRRVLVERRSWFDDRHVAELRSAGNDVRQCTGPRRETGRVCPLVTSGQCRLAEQADLIASRIAPRYWRPTGGAGRTGSRSDITRDAHAADPLAARESPGRYNNLTQCDQPRSSPSRAVPPSL